MKSSHKKVRKWLHSELLEKNYQKSDQKVTYQNVLSHTKRDSIVLYYSLSF